MSAFTEGKPEFADGKPISLDKIAQALKKFINEGNYESIQNVLNSFVEIETANDLINLLSKQEFEELIKLQENAQNIKQEEIEKYVSLSDKLAQNILRVLQGVHNATSQDAENNNQEIKPYINEIKTFLYNFTSTLSNQSQNIQDYAKDILEIISNTYQHTRVFLNTVLKNQKDEKQDIKVGDVQERVTELESHIYNKYGHLLFVYNRDNNSFTFDDQLTNILMPEVIHYIKTKNVRNYSNFKIMGKQISEPAETYNNLQERAANETSSNSGLKRRHSLPKNFKFELDDEIIKIINDELILYTPTFYENVVTTLVKRKRYDENPTCENPPSSQSSKRPKPNEPKGGKSNRKTRRKIRRKNKTKTKKLKKNKKTKRKNINKKRRLRKTNKRIKK